MGFAASQARFLSLTARLSDNEFEAQQIAQQRSDLADTMEIISDEYYNAISNQLFVATVSDQTGLSKVALTYDVIVNDSLNGGLGYQLIDSSGKIVVPDEETMYKMIAQSNGASPSTEDSETTMFNGSTPVQYSVPSKLTVEDFYICKDVKDPTLLQKSIENGSFNFGVGIEKDNSERGWSWITKGHENVNCVTKEYDKTDDGIAQAKYDKEIRHVQKEDTKLEMQMERLETQHKAIETEMDSVQKVIDDNIESSFKTFG